MVVKDLLQHITVHSCHELIKTSVYVKVSSAPQQ